MHDQKNGSISWKKSSIILRIYSVGFARYLIKKHLKKVDLVFSESEITLEKGGNFKPRFERVKVDQPITIFTITKIVPESIRNALRNKKSIKFKVKISKIVDCELLKQFQRNIVDYTFEPVNKEILKQNAMKTGCFISCSRSNNNLFYRLSFRHKIFDEIALNSYPIVFERKENGNFTIIKRKDGVQLHYSKGNKRGSGIAYVQLPEKFVLPKEKELFASGRRAISYKAIISIKDFNLDISKYFTDPKERELAFELLRRKILIRHPQPKLREADIVLEETGNQIEVTKIAPIMPLQKNNAHGEGVHINARICEGYLRVKTGEIRKYYLVLDNRWLSFPWVKELTRKTCNQVKLLPTDFNNHWVNEVADSIEREERK